MISRKKRQRYKSSAFKIAKDLGIEINLESWEDVWDLLNLYKEPEYLYVIGEVGGLEVKLGKSVNPGYRLKQLQAGCPVKLVLWGFCKQGSPNTEQEVHKELKQFRSHGEWFLLSEEVRGVIERIKAV